MALARGLGLCAAPEVRDDANPGPRDTAGEGQVDTPPLWGLTRGSPPVAASPHPNLGALEMLCLVFLKWRVTLISFARCSHLHWLGVWQQVGYLCPGLPGAEDEEAPHP